MITSRHVSFVADMKQAAIDRQLITPLGLVDDAKCYT